MTENEIRIRDYKVANYRRWLMEEAALIQELRKRTKISNKIELNMKGAYKNDMTISRMLGHHKLIPNSG